MSRDPGASLFWWPEALPGIRCWVCIMMQFNIITRKHHIIYGSMYINHQKNMLQAYLQERQWAPCQVHSTPVTSVQLKKEIKKLKREERNIFYCIVQSQIAIRLHFCMQLVYDSVYIVQLTDDAQSRVFNRLKDTCTNPQPWILSRKQLQKAPDGSRNLAASCFKVQWTHYTSRFGHGRPCGRGGQLSELHTKVSYVQTLSPLQLWTGLKILCHRAVAHWIPFSLEAQYRQFSLLWRTRCFLELLHF